MRFRRYALERIAAAVGALFLAAVTVYVICHALGLGRLSPDALARDPALAARYRTYVHESFGDFLWRLVGHASLGRSFYGSADLAALSFKAATVTLSVVVWTLFIGLLLAVPLGLAWDRRPTWPRRITPFFVYLAASLLTIWVALELSLHLGLSWEIFPVSGYADFFDPPKGATGGPVQWAYHLILPGFVLGLPVAAIYMRVVRALARDVRRAREEASPGGRPEAVRRARTTAAIVFAKGLLRDTGFLMGAAVFMEMGFALPGLGRTIVVATQSKDAPLLEGVLVVGTLLAVTIAVTGNLVGGAVSRQWRSGS